MPTSQVHDKRIYFGLEDAKPLIGWLNSDATEKLKVAVVNFLQVNAEITAHPTHSQLAHAQAVYDQMCALLETGGYYVDTRVVAETDDRGQIHWAEREFRIGPVDKSKIPGAVYSSVMALEKLDLLDRVRQCARPDCKRWFFARFPHARFDSVNCQRETLRADPKWRKGRSAYMRRLRQTHKRLEQGKKPKPKKGGK